MKQQSLTWFSWKRLVFTLLFIGIILCAIYIFTLNNYINASKTKGFDHTESVILSETSMVSVQNMYAFQDDILYHIAYSRDDNDKEWVIFVPKTEKVEVNDKDKADKGKNEKEKTITKKDIKKKDIITFEANKFHNKEDIESAWQQECNQCELRSSSPAIIDDTPAWELTYIDDNNRFVMEYRKLEDTEVMEQFKLRRKYNLKG